MLFLIDHEIENAEVIKLDVVRPHEAVQVFAVEIAHVGEVHGVEDVDHLSPTLSRPSTGSRMRSTTQHHMTRTITLQPFVR